MSTIFSEVKQTDSEGVVADVYRKSTRKFAFGALHEPCGRIVSHSLQVSLSELVFASKFAS
jgi:hypothetical protein